MARYEVDDVRPVELKLGGTYREEWKKTVVPASFSRMLYPVLASSLLDTTVPHINNDRFSSVDQASTLSLKGDRI